MLEKFLHVDKLAKLVYFAIIIGILYFMLPFLLPFLLAIVIAVLFEPIIKWIGIKTKIGRKAASLFIITSFFAIISYTIYLIVSKLAKEGYNLIIKIPDFVNYLIKDNEHIRELYSDLSPNNQNYIQESISTLISKASEFVSSIIPTIINMASAFPSYFIASIVFVVSTYIVSLELPKLKPAFLKYFETGKSLKKVEIGLEKLKSATVGFLRAQIILSILTFIIVYIGLWIIGFDYKASLSLLVVFVDLLPIFGTGMVLVPWAIYLLISGSIYKGVGLIILFIFITMFRRAAESKLISDSIGISPLMTLASLYIGFELMGLIGMVVGPTILIIISALEEARLLKIKLKI